MNRHSSTMTYTPTLVVGMLLVEWDRAKSYHLIWCQVPRSMIQRENTSNYGVLNWHLYLQFIYLNLGICQWSNRNNLRLYWVKIKCGLLNVISNLKIIMGMIRIELIWKMIMKSNSNVLWKIKAIKKQVIMQMIIEVINLIIKEKIEMI